MVVPDGRRKRLSLLMERSLQGEFGSVVSYKEILQGKGVMAAKITRIIRRLAAMPEVDRR